jgi:hypothetical protein
MCRLRAEFVTGISTGYTPSTRTLGKDRLSTTSATRCPPAGDLGHNAPPRCDCKPISRFRFTTRNATIDARNQFFLRWPGRTFWASEFSAIPRNPGTRILGREGFWAPCPVRQVPYVRFLQVGRAGVLAIEAFLEKLQQRNDLGEVRLSIVQKGDAPLVKPSKHVV